MLLRVGALLTMVSYVSSVSSLMCATFFACSPGAARIQLAAAVSSAAGVGGLLSVVSAGIALQVGVHAVIPVGTRKRRSARTSACKDDIFLKPGSRVRARLDVGGARAECMRGGC